MNQVSEPPVASTELEESGYRDDKGRFVNGHPPLGHRPKVSIIAIIKEKLAEVPIGQRRTVAETLAEQILDAAVVGRSETMQKEILHYVDGMPNQKIDFGVDKENIGELTSFLQAIAKKTDDKPDNSTGGEPK